MEPFQIIAILFAIFSLSRVFLRFKKQQITGREFLMWAVIWIAVILIAADPAIAVWLSGFFGVGRPIDLVVYLSIIVLFYLIFRVYAKIQAVEQRITTVVREIAKQRKK